MTPKKQFILDENVLIFAQTGTNEQGEPDGTCSKLINDIIGICHTIVIDLALFARYQHQLNQARHRPATRGSAMLPILLDATRITGKYDRFDRASAPPFDGEETIPQGSQDDVQVSVRLAVQTKATLVTADGPLKRHLETSDLEVLRDLRVVNPQEALGLL